MHSWEAEMFQVSENRAEILKCMEVRKSVSLLKLSGKSGWMMKIEGWYPTCIGSSRPSKIERLVHLCVNGYRCSTRLCFVANIVYSLCQKNDLRAGSYGRNSDWRKNISTIRYADDNRVQKSIQNITKRIGENNKAIGREINSNKTKLMAIGKLCGMLRL